MNSPEITPEILANELCSTANTAILEFMSLYGNDSSIVFIAVEGAEDLFYYRPRIHVAKSSFIVCYNRKNVLHLRDFIHKKSEYKKAIIGYIIDRDYENNSCIPKDVYITPCYSVENFYCSQNAFENILTDHFSLQKDNPLYEKIIKFYTKQYVHFLSEILLFHAWYLCLLEKGYKGVVIKDFVDKYINLEIDNIYKKYTLDDLEKKYKDAPRISIDAIYKKMSMLRHNSRLNVRGKDLLKFVIVFLKFMKTQWNKKDGLYHTQQNRTCQLQLSKDNILAELSSVADTPYCLDVYIKTIVLSKSHNIIRNAD